MTSREHTIPCPSCGYDLRASVREDGSASCAECGATHDAKTIRFVCEGGATGSWRDIGILTIPGGLFAIAATVAATTHPSPTVTAILLGSGFILLVLSGVVSAVLYHRDRRLAAHPPHIFESIAFGLILLFWNIAVGVAGFGVLAAITGVFQQGRF